MIVAKLWYNPWSHWKLVLDCCQFATYFLNCLESIVNKVKWHRNATHTCQTPNLINFPSKPIQTLNQLNKQQKATCKWEHNRRANQWNQNEEKDKQLNRLESTHMNSSLVVVVICWFIQYTFDTFRLNKLFRVCLSKSVENFTNQTKETLTIVTIRLCCIFYLWLVF